MQLALIGEEKNTVDDAITDRVGLIETFICVFPIYLIINSLHFMFSN